MQAQTLALAFMAALYPVGLLAVSLLLATDRPMKLGLSFFAGAATSLLVVGILFITVLHGVGLNDGGSANDQEWLSDRARYGHAGCRFADLSPRPPPRSQERAGLEGPAGKARPGAVFVSGAILYSPSGTYLGAVQQIASSKSGWAPALQLLVVIAIVLLTVEIPLLAYALEPQVTTRALQSAQGWIDRHGRQALELVLLLIGSYLVIDGITVLVT